MTDIIPFDHKGAAQLPAHLQQNVEALGGENIAARASINQLSYRGKVWRRVIGGEEATVTKKDENGDVVAVQIINLVILDNNKNRSRTWYAGDYVAGENKAPDCWSSDGVKPDASIKTPQATTCATCKWSAKGSKTTAAGKATTACAPNKRLAVVPSGNIGKVPPLLLRLAQTSLWDKENAEEAQGWYALDQYFDMLRARGVKHTAMVETRVKFDTSVEYPKLLFSAARYMNPDEITALGAVIKDNRETIDKILVGGDADGTMGGAGESAKTAAENGVAGGTGADATAAAAAKAAADAKAAEDAKAAAKAEKQRKAAAAAEAAKAAAEAAAAAAAALDGDDDGFGGGGLPPAGASSAGVTDVEIKNETKVTSKAADSAPAATSAAGVVEGTPAGVASLLEGWDD